MATVPRPATSRTGPRQPHQADAARLHGDELAIGGEPAEADQDAEQHRHRNRQAERLRQQREQERGATIDHSTPREMNCSACVRIGGISRMNVSTVSPSRKGSRDLANEIAVENADHASQTRLAP